MEDENKQWQICCSKTSKDCIMFATQVAAAGVVLCVSLYMLTTKTESRELYVSLLSTSVGILLPNPKLP